MVWRLLWQRLKGLAREEDGAAMVITLAVFFFMYLMIAGVYAVGTAVKNRVQLQLACDAAAYSAAVVQADTLSRIATLNRAMSWTYVQMTRRQMDYIVYKWLQHTRRHFQEDRQIAQDWHKKSKDACSLHNDQPEGWFIGVIGEDKKRSNAVKLNGVSCVDIDDIASRCDAFIDSSEDGHLNSQMASFYAVSGNLGENELRAQIRADQGTIKAMNDREKYLKGEMTSCIIGAVTNVLKANATSANQYYYVAMDNPITYLQTMEMKQEDRFLSFAGYTSHETTFKAGIDKWMCLSGDDEDDENRENPIGFCRKYKQSDSALLSEWNWWSAWWNCHFGHKHKYYKGECPHGCRHDTSTDYLFNACLTAGNLHDDCFDGACAKPLILTKDYFGKAGTITVGLAQHNENPWLSLLGDTTRGIFSAFNPFSRCEWSWAFASAKAGYKYLDDKTYEDETDADGRRRRNRKYRIDWDESNQDWNLCQSDWDAVLLPVRRAETMAETKPKTLNAEWGSGGNTTFLAEYVNESWERLGDNDDEGVNIQPDTRMVAGGSKSIDSDSIDGLVQRWDELRSVDVDYDNTGNVQAEWAIERERSDSAPGHLDWSRITERMFH